MKMLFACRMLQNSVTYVAVYGNPLCTQQQDIHTTRYEAENASQGDIGSTPGQRDAFFFSLRSSVS